MITGFGKYEWTEHSKVKMRQYGLSEQRVIRIIRAPFRYEEGVIEKGVAVMQPASVTKTLAGRPEEWKQEIWVMYVLKKSKKSGFKKDGGLDKLKMLNLPVAEKKIRIITAWRYPGKSPKRDPIPMEVIQEVRRLL